MGDEKKEARAQVVKLRRQITQWRKTKTWRCAPMPEELWQQAVELSQQLGVASVCKELKLDYQKLKSKAQLVESTETSPVSTQGFVELRPIPLTSRQDPQLIQLELQSPKGLRLRLQGSRDDIPPLHHLIESFMRTGS